MWNESNKDLMNSLTQSLLLAQSRLSCAYPYSISLSR